MRAPLLERLARLLPQDLERTTGFAQKIRGALDEEAPRVPLPRSCDPLVDRGRLACGLNPQRVVVVIPIADGRRAEVNHGPVATQLLWMCRPHVAPEIARTWPVCTAIDRAAVAKYGSAIFVRQALELALHVEDRSLGALPRGDGRSSGKAAPEHDPCRLREHLYAVAEMPSNQLQDSGLAGSGPTGQYDSADPEVTFAKVVTRHDATLL